MIYLFVLDDPLSTRTEELPKCCAEGEVMVM